MITKYLVVSCLFLSVFMGALAQRAEAHPVAFAGSYSLMTWNNKEMTDWMLNYSFTPHYALAVRHLRIETREGERNFYLPQLNFLLKRWNELESQGNVYLSVGHGGEKINNSFKDTSALALEADWESRKYYVSFKEEALLSNKDSKRNIYSTKVRAGFAPYLAEFDELNAWFILQADTSNKGDKDYKLTPLIRLFYQNVLMEFGSSMKGDSQFNFMVHF